jgi:hypothetical protein
MKNDLYTYTPIPDIGWGVVISRPTAAAFSTQIFLRQVVIVVQRQRLS